MGIMTKSQPTKNDAKPATPSPTVDVQLMATAYHEAGHAVMALLMGRNVHRVSVKPKQSRLGECELRKDKTRQTKDPIEADALIMLAGMVAESRFTGKYNAAAAQTDLQAVQKLAEFRGGGERQIAKLFRRWMDKAEHLLDQPPQRFAIDAITQQLIEREKISGRNALHHFKEAKLKAEKLEGNQ